MLLGHTCVVEEDKGPAAVGKFAASSLPRLGVVTYVLTGCRQWEIVCWRRLALICSANGVLPWCKTVWRLSSLVCMIQSVSKAPAATNASSSLRSAPRHVRATFEMSCFSKSHFTHRRMAISTVAFQEATSYLRNSLHAMIRASLPLAPGAKQ